MNKKLDDNILKEHNYDIYTKVADALENEGMAWIVHPTGGGKSFIAIKAIKDFAQGQKKKVLFVAPTKIIQNAFIDNCKKCLGNDISNIETSTYANLKNLSDNKYDFIVFDEVHRAGAISWGKSVQNLIENNNDAQIFGMTATPERGDSVEVQQTIFKGKEPVSVVKVVDLIRKEILPKPRYCIAQYSYETDDQNSILNETLSKREEQLINLQKACPKDAKDQRELKELQEQVKSLRKLLLERKDISKVFNSHLSNEQLKKGKFIVFCPINRNNRNPLEEHEENRDDLKVIREIHDKAEEWFPNSNLHHYVVHSSCKNSHNEQEIKEFERDKNDAVKLLYTVNMLNEGKHVKDVDGIICLRPTSSPIIFQQQLGRVLSVGGKKDVVVFDLVANLQFHNILETKQLISAKPDNLEEKKDNEKRNKSNFDAKEKNADIFDCDFVEIDLLEKLNLFNDKVEKLYKTAETVYPVEEINSEMESFKPTQKNLKTTSDVIKAIRFYQLKTGKSYIDLTYTKKGEPNHDDEIVKYANTLYATREQLRIQLKNGTLPKSIDAYKIESSFPGFMVEENVMYKLVRFSKLFEAQTGVNIADAKAKIYVRDPLQRNKLITFGANLASLKSNIRTGKRDLTDGEITLIKENPNVFGEDILEERAKNLAKKASKYSLKDNDSEKFIEAYPKLIRINPRMTFNVINKETCFWDKDTKTVINIGEFAEHVKQAYIGEENYEPLSAEDIEFYKTKMPGFLPDKQKDIPTQKQETKVEQEEKNIDQKLENPELATQTKGVSKSVLTIGWLIRHYEEKTGLLYSTIKQKTTIDNPINNNPNARLGEKIARLRVEINKGRLPPNDKKYLQYNFPRLFEKSDRNQLINRYEKECEWFLHKYPNKTEADITSQTDFEYAGEIVYIGATQNSLRMAAKGKGRYEALTQKEIEYLNKNHPNALAEGISKSEKKIKRILKESLAPILDKELDLYNKVTGKNFYNVTPTTIFLNPNTNSSVKIGQTFQTMQKAEAGLNEYKPLTENQKQTLDKKYPGIVAKLCESCKGTQGNQEENIEKN